MTTFPISKVDAICARAAEARPEPKNAPIGWSKSVLDPMELLGVFESLHMKPGFVLRAYQFREGDNGNGFIWAMPESAPFPDPAECPRLKDRFLEPPKPPQALDDLVDAIDGDGSPWSYFSASLFAREAAEFGAIWHGSNWSTHCILGADPWQHDPTAEDPRIRQPRVSGSRPDEWTWIEPKPETWEPSCAETGGIVAISFLTFSQLGREAIYRFTDTFKRGSYAFKTELATVAEGLYGITF